MKKADRPVSRFICNCTDTSAIFGIFGPFMVLMPEA